MSVDVAAYRYHPSLQRWHDTSSFPLLPLHSMPRQYDASPLLLASPRPLAAELSDPLSDLFPDSPPPFDSPFTTQLSYHSLDSPPPLFHATDSHHSSNSSVSSTSTPISVAATTLATPIEQALVSAPVIAQARRKREERSSGQERLVRKRRKQQECDIDRRRRENTALIQLQQFIEEERQPDGQAEDAPAKQHKADVLQQSVQLIELLKRRVAELSGDSSSPHSTPPPHTALSPSQAASSAVGAAMRASSLRSPLRDAHAGVCLILVHASSNRILDATSRFLACTGFQRTQLVGRRWPRLHTQRDTNQRAVRLSDNPVLVAGGRGGLLVPQRQEAQYERSVRLREALYGGRVDKIEAAWRAQLADGRLYEFQATSWISEWEEEAEGGGGDAGKGEVKRRPLEALSVVSGTEIVCVD